MGLSGGARLSSVRGRSSRCVFWDFLRDLDYKFSVTPQQPGEVSGTFQPAPVRRPRPRGAVGEPVLAVRVAPAVPEARGTTHFSRPVAGRSPQPTRRPTRNLWVFALVLGIPAAALTAILPTTAAEFATHGLRAAALLAAAGGVIKRDKQEKRGWGLTVAACAVWA